MIPKPMIQIGLVFLLASWFLLVERQNVWEKILLLFFAAVIYFSFRLMTGSTMDQALEPIRYIVSR